LFPESGYKYRSKLVTDQHDLKRFLLFFTIWGGWWDGSPDGGFATEKREVGPRKTMLQVEAMNYGNRGRVGNLIQAARMDGYGSSKAWFG
jgi:hypothetical protein